ncbi:Uncharacterised protein [Brevibacterium casei]|uniref:Uncharacterized protein n=1 Tax=Brevibacterium casei TaxID=33889 RepID=A0A449DCC4_9MICO|nr:Uncharacterised protein [Brevibacterium casei]
MGPHALPHRGDRRVHRYSRHHHRRHLRTHQRRDDSGPRPAEVPCSVPGRRVHHRPRPRRDSVVQERPVLRPPPHRRLPRDPSRRHHHRDVQEVARDEGQRPRTRRRAHPTGIRASPGRHHHLPRRLIVSHPHRAIGRATGVLPPHRSVREGDPQRQHGCVRRPDPRRCRHRGRPRDRGTDVRHLHPHLPTGPHPGPHRGDRHRGDRHQRTTARPRRRPQRRRCRRADHRSRRGGRHLRGPLGDRQPRSARRNRGMHRRRQRRHHYRSQH